MDLMVYDGMVEKVFIGNQEDRERNQESNGVGSNGKKNGKDKKGKRKKDESESDSEESSSDDGSTKKKKGKKGKKVTVKRSKSGKAKKKRSKMASDEEEEEESSESEFDEDAPAKKSKRRKRGSDDKDEEEEDAEDEDDRKSKKSKRKKKDRSKKRHKALPSDAEDSDDENGGFKAEIDEDVKPKIEHEHADGEDAESAERMKNYVYRLIRPYTPVIGWTDMPCGKCPVEEFCTEPSRPRAGILKRPTTALDSAAGGGGGPKMKIELEGGIQGVGMLGGVGAAVGVSLAKWGEMKGQVGKGVAPVNPRDCVYFKDWLTADAGHEE